MPRSKSVSVSRLEGYISRCRVVGKDRKVTGIAPLHSAKPGDLSFCNKLEFDLTMTRASIILVPYQINNGIVGKTLIGVDNSRLWFIRCVNKFFPIPKPRIRIGKHVYMDRGVVVGSEGFGYERNEKGGLEKFPHIGGVIIEDDVDIGANVCIDRGSLEDTVIGRGTKIDNLVHIAHNVKVGRHCLITANTFIGGGAVIEDYATIWAGVTIKHGVTIGHHAVVGAGSVVLHDVPDAITVAGVPARSLGKMTGKSP